MAEKHHNGHGPCVAVVAGSSRGIGLACIDMLRTGPYSIAGLSRSGTERPNVLDVHCDVLDRDATAAAFARILSELGTPQVLIVSSGGLHEHAPIAMTSERSLERHVELNLTSVIRMIKQVCRPMMRTRWGRIVVVGSVAAELGATGATSYAAAKAGLIGLARSLGDELSPYNITVNVVSPGLIETPLLTGAATNLARISAAIPLGRLGQAAEVASVIQFLISDDAEAVTGQCIRVDGGLTARLP